MNVLTKVLSSTKWTVLGIVGAALAWKALLLALGSVPFNSDEAVVALMARHILQGERPIFFYGQAYMGSLDALLVAAGFWLFGQQVWVIRWVQALLYAGLIITTIGLGQEAYGSKRVGILAAILMVVPPVNVTLYTTASLGGYGEALLLGNLGLYFALRIANQTREIGALAAWPKWLGWAFLAGLGMWANGLTLIYTVPAGLMLLLMLFKQQKLVGAARCWGIVGAVAAGFLIGSAPWWWYALTQGSGGLVAELLGSAVAVEQDPWLVRTGNHMLSFVLLGGTVILGLRPPWGVQWLGLPLLPFVLMAWGAILVASSRGFSQPGALRWGRWLMNGVLLTLAAGFVFTSFGVDPSGRYFLPFVVPMSLAAADALPRLAVRLRWQVALMVLLLGYSAWGTLESVLRNPPGLTTQFNAVTQVDTRYQTQLIDFLKSEGETRGYSNYWVAYPTAFLSAETLIFIPSLPYHPDLRYTARDNRYLPYVELVTSAQRVAYITTLNANLDARLEQGFRRLSVEWQETRIGDYHVYYRLSRPVRPEELDLGSQP